MTGAKVEFLEKVNNEDLKRPLWKFNYSNIGESKGDFTFENWMADAQTILRVPPSARLSDFGGIF